MEQALTHVANGVELARRFSSELTEINRRSDVVEASIYSGAPASDNNIEANIAYLRSIWPMTDSFYVVLRQAIVRNGITSDRLCDAVNNLIDTHKFGNSFTPAELLSFDKTIKCYRSFSAMKKSLGEDIRYSDIALIAFNGERKYTLLDDAERYGCNILAVFEDNGDAIWKGTYTNKDFAIRQKEFYNQIRHFFNNPYSGEVCRAFYDYWSQPIEAGDVMLKERKWQKPPIDMYGRIDHLSHVKDYLDEFYNRFYKPKNN